MTALSSPNSYGVVESFRLENGSAGGGNVTVTITDDSDNTCTVTGTIVDPGTCSIPNCNATITVGQPICNSNSTPANSADDWFSLSVTGDITDGSGSYVVKIGAFTSAVTASGTPINIVGNGLSGNPLLAANGSSTYTVRIEDSVDNTCFDEIIVSIWVQHVVRVLTQIVLGI
ncbi:MAG: hypothetical protein R2766_02620 [Saprospiraceae bacterium]